MFKATGEYNRHLRIFNAQTTANKARKLHFVMLTVESKFDRKIGRSEH